ncbi:hypothetical protein ACHAWF_016636 [Thalassiosira exigua]
MPTEWGTIDYYVDRLSSGTPPLHIDVCDFYLTDEDAFRLAEALAAGADSGTTLKKLRLRGSQITSRGFLALAEAIGGVAGSTSALEELDLGYTVDIANDVDDFAFGIYLLLSASNGLKHLNLEGSFIGRSAGMALADVIAGQGEHLETLDLRNNGIDDEAATRLASKIRGCKKLTRIDLGLNYIQPKGAMALADFIAANPPLQHLILRGNCIGDEGAVHFAKALKNNTNLIELNLGHNQISSVGLEALFHAIFDVSSLNALVESNHTLRYLLNGQSINNLVRRGCDVKVLFDINNILQLNEMDGMFKQSSGKLPDWASELPLSTLSIEQLKVVIYLTKCFEMKHFLALDKTMIPQALQFVASHLGCEKVFQLLGQWNMPLLFLPDAHAIQSH